MCSFIPRSRCNPFFQFTRRTPSFPRGACGSDPSPLSAVSIVCTSGRRSPGGNGGGSCGVVRRQIGKRGPAWSHRERLRVEQRRGRVGQIDDAADRKTSQQSAGPWQRACQRARGRRCLLLPFVIANEIQRLQRGDHVVCPDVGVGSDILN